MVNISPEESRIHFDGYRVQPVVETAAQDGIEKSYQAFRSLAEAEAELVRFENKAAIDGAEGKRILWSLYGIHQGIAEHIADRSSEAEAFALLSAITGIAGTSGRVDYPLPPLWIVIHEHRFGSTAWGVASPEKPTVRQLVRCLDINYEPRREESISIHALDTIDHLDSQDGNDMPFE